MKRLDLSGMSEAGTEALGARLADSLFPGAFIALYGDLGAGKTTLARAVAKRLGIAHLTSPTFTIVREYAGRLPLFHFDAYRLSSADELYDIGYDDYVARRGIIMMEWCENVADALPSERLEIHITGSGDVPRNIELEAHGIIYEALLEGIKC